MLVPSCAGQRFQNDDNSTVSTQLSVKEIENSIASMNAEQIKGLAQSLVGDVMERLNIDIRNTDTSRHILTNHPSTGKGCVLVNAKIYDPNSILMKILLPVCIERITKSFSTPEEFLQKGIVFDFLNPSKSGLLDQVEDENLKRQISEGMRNSSTFSMTLKAKGEEKLKFEIEQFKDGKFIASHKAAIENLVNSSYECVI